MKIIGISHDLYISSAVLIQDGEIIAAAPEERFTRAKRTRYFPQNAIQFCLDKEDCRIEDIDYFSTSWNPGVYFKSFNPLFSGRRRFKGEYLYAIPDYLLQFFKHRHAEYIEQNIQLFNTQCRIYFIQHHHAHIGNAYFLSPFDNAAILIADEQGEFSSVTYASGIDNDIKIFQSQSYPHSLGTFYSGFTDFLGFRPNSDEWKVMALSAWADTSDKYYDKVRKMVELLPEGRFELDLSYFNTYDPEQPEPNMYTEKFIKNFEAPRKRDQPLSEREYKLASAMQQVAEETAFHLLDWLYKKSKQKNLAVAGGFFMNSVLNGKILRNTPFEKIFISSCPDDSGSSIGSALYLYHEILRGKKRRPLTHNFFGPKFSNKEIEKTIKKFQLNHKFVGDIEKFTAQLLSEDKLVGWFQGRMEFGQRALGNRSILTTPKKKDMKDKVNRAVKYREAFRPFAPSILLEDTDDYFDIDEGVEAPFMEKVYRIKQGKRNLIPAVVHVDGSGRLQTVTKDTNPKFHKLLREFKKITGVPVLLNTSFNLSGEPIVCTPKDAVRTFYSCGLDVLVMGNYVIIK